MGLHLFVVVHPHSSALLLLLSRLCFACCLWCAVCIAVVLLLEWKTLVCCMQQRSAATWNASQGRGVTIGVIILRITFKEQQA